MRKVLKEKVQPARSLGPSQHGKQDPLFGSGSKLLKTISNTWRKSIELYNIQLLKPGQQGWHVHKKRLLTCPPESFETGCTANDITGSGTLIEVIVYLTDPSVKVSPDDQEKKYYSQYNIKTKI